MSNGFQNGSRLSSWIFKFLNFQMVLKVWNADIRQYAKFRQNRLKFWKYHNFSIFKMRPSAGLFVRCNRLGGGLSSTCA